MLVFVQKRNSDFRTYLDFYFEHKDTNNMKIIPVYVSKRCDFINIDSISIALSKLFIGEGNDYLFCVSILDVWKSRDIFSCSRKGILLLSPPSAKYYLSKQ